MLFANAYLDIVCAVFVGFVGDLEILQGEKAESSCICWESVVVSLSLCWALWICVEERTWVCTLWARSSMADCLALSKLFPVPTP